MCKEAHHNVREESHLHMNVEKSKEVDSSLFFSFKCLTIQVRGWLYDPIRVNVLTLPFFSSIQRQSVWLRLSESFLWPVVSIHDPTLLLWCSGVLSFIILWRILWCALSKAWSTTWINEPTPLWIILLSTTLLRLWAVLSGNEPSEHG